MSTDLQSQDELFEDINGNVQRLQEMIQSMVVKKKRLKLAQAAELEEHDKSMLTFLWRCRKLLSTAKMARMVGLSRQALYSKWRRYGYNVDDEASI